MGRFAILREKLGKYKEDIMPKPLRRLEYEIQKSGNWDAHCAGVGLFEVERIMMSKRFVVSLNNRSCTWNFWQLVWIPYRHAIYGMSFIGEDPQSYVHAYYRRQAYEATYGPIISPINGQNQWPENDLPEILPPFFKQGPGRPKKLRRRDPLEEPPKKVRRKNNQNKCRRCHQLGHNIKTCRNPHVTQPQPQEDPSQPQETTQT